jgi:protein gp37
MSDDPVNPSQYHGDLVARIIERFDLNFNLGNVAKYLLRHKNKNGIWGPKGTRPIAAESYWTQPLRWNKKAEQEGIRRRVFCGSLCDFFEGFQTMPEEAYDPTIVARERTFKLVDQTPWLDWLFLTKRPENILELSSYIVDCTGANVQKNAWFGASVEDLHRRLRVLVAARDLSIQEWVASVIAREVANETPASTTHVGASQQ